MMTTRTSSWSSVSCADAHGSQMYLQPWATTHESPTDYVPSSSENLKNIHGVL